MIEIGLMVVLACIGFALVWSICNNTYEDDCDDWGLWKTTTRTHFKNDEE